MLTYLPREPFLNEYWNWKPGEHVVFFEPTQQGKTSPRAEGCPDDRRD